MFNYEEWLNFRSQKRQEYPCPRGKWRFDLELMHPRDNLEDVLVDRNPHGFGLSAHSCFYKCDDWSTIFGVREFDQNGPCLRMLVESGNPEPLWGERITLFSTSSYIQDEEWGTNVANKFAYFHGKYWKIQWHEFLHNGYNELYEVMGNRIDYPIRMEPYPFNGCPVAGPQRHNITYLPNGIWDFDNWFADYMMGLDNISVETRKSNRIETIFNWNEDGF